MNGGSSMIKLQTIVSKLGGSLMGNSDFSIAGIGSLERANPNDLTFYLATSSRNLLLSTRSMAIVVSSYKREVKEKSQIVTENPHLYFARVINEFFERDARPLPSKVDERASLGLDVVVGARVTIGANAVVGDRTFLGDDVVVGPGCFIGAGAEIGAGSKIYANATVYPGVKIGKRAIIHSGAVLGGDGFGFVSEEGQWYKVPQVGKLIIGDDVEVGSNTTIDRGALDDTVIGNGVKVDNQVQIGHNCLIDDHTAIAGCVGIAGSVKIGKRCKIGGAAMVTGHLTIADDVTISAGSLVSKTILQAGRYTGVYPLTTHADWLSGAIRVRRLGQTREG
jgi:UDP-3-O-[3-hydroxymyristoyl] glucosamine N-acyltransferase